MITAALRQVTRAGLSRAPIRSNVITLTYGASRFARTIVTKRYTEEHEMITYDDATSQGTLYITEYASKSLGDVVFVELPKEGTEVAKGDQIGAVESVKAASDIYAPVSGTIDEINKALGDRPGLMSSKPETEGWLCRLKLSKPTELDALLSVEAYKKFCEGLDN